MDKPVIDNPALLAAAIKGLTAEPKHMEPKWFYDQRGSALFEEITELSEYYPTRTEIAILQAGRGVLAEYVPENAELLELGSGASTKTRLILDHVTHLAAYIPIDISADFLAETAGQLAEDYPHLEIEPWVTDFTGSLDLGPGPRPRVAFFPGSTLGNLAPRAAQSLLRDVRGWPGISAFILGVDLIKDPEVLIAAYDDAKGVTAAFNRNLLTRMNREIGADFDPSAFAHRAVWNAGEARIEMHLESEHAQEVNLPGRRIRFDPGETIHTENSRKYDIARLEALADATGWRMAEVLVDANRYFAVLCLVPD